MPEGGGDKKILDFDIYDLEIISGETKDLIDVSRTIESLNTQELLSDGGNLALAEFQWRLSQPISLLILSFIAGYPLKYLFTICGTGLAGVLLFFMTIKAFPGVFPNRVDTWLNRIENFSNGTSSDGNYQVERAKTAIVNGKIFGVGAGKVFKLGKLPLNFNAHVYYNVEAPVGYGDFQTRFQLQFLFPRG